MLSWQRVSVLLLFSTASLHRWRHIPGHRCSPDMGWDLFIRGQLYGEDLGIGDTLPREGYIFLFVFADFAVSNPQETRQHTGCIADFARTSEFNARRNISAT